MVSLGKFVAAAAIAALLAGCGSGEVGSVGNAGAGAVVPAPSAPVAQSAPISDVTATRRSAHRLTTAMPSGLLQSGGSTVGLCAPSANSRQASCLGMLHLGSVQITGTGLTPSDLSTIYGYPDPRSQAAGNTTVGVVVAYDNMNAENDLATYRSHFGLRACTKANGCFKKVGAAAVTHLTSIGGGPTSVSAHPTGSIAGWNAESDADIEAVSAVCSGCKIVLAEAASDNLSDLGAAVSAAVAAGATVVNTSFGAPEAPSQHGLEAAFEPAHARVIAASGDSGPAALFPAAATNVVAVAGTTLKPFGEWVFENLWSGSGGGCSHVFARPSYQPAWCGSMRSIADVAVVADPADGLSFYDTGIGGWGVIGGTSIAAPIVSGMFALSGDTSAGPGAAPLYKAFEMHFLPIYGMSSHITGQGAPADLEAF